MPTDSTVTLPLLRTIIANAKPQAGQVLPRWAVVRALCGVGSTSAHRLCVAAGFDPDEELGQAVHPWTECPTCGQEVTDD